MALEYEPDESTLVAISLFAKMMVVGEKPETEHLS